MSMFKINVNFESINSTIKIKNNESNLSVSKEISNWNWNVLKLNNK